MKSPGNNAVTAFSIMMLQKKNKTEKFLHNSDPTLEIISQVP